MEQQQFEELRDLLSSIDSKLEDIASNTSPVYDASDVCSRLDTLISIMDK
ncbi:hypothetical protein [Winogradskyella damuponensis]|uniref:Uncharacterized protein n=1 Tax=Winogradskyella damuponensis TaxID=943939 RepID=A0ABP8CIZ5_9FLAO